MKRNLVFLVVLLLSFLAGRSQTGCTTLGQTPATAFPVCGTDVFSQTTVPACENNLVPTNCSANDGLLYKDLNPYWYKFTCFQSGTLGLTIKPNIATDDYDWQLFDVTGKDISLVYTDKSLIVAYNWSGSTGTTGTASNAASLFVCATTGQNPNQPLFSKMPQLIQGHEYLLMISHFTGDQQSGYELSFKGGTASITDTTPPRLSQVVPSCDGTELRITLNKKMRCNSLVANGTDFILSGGATVASAASASCSNGFDMDALVLKLSNPLPPGNYTVTAQNGSDGNSILDNCDNGIPLGDNLAFAIAPPQPTPIDSLAPVSCAPQQLRLVFDKGIRCNSIAANGSDFVLTGPQAVAVTGAAGTCANGLTLVIDLTLSSPIVVGGTYTLTVANGSDFNSIIDECGQATPSGMNISFVTRDTVSADFAYPVALGCRNDTVYFSHDGRNGVDQWQWWLDGNLASTAQSLSMIYSASSQHQARLIVSNGFCSDTSTVDIVLDNEVIADFDAPAIICPEDSLPISNTSQGLVDLWNWQFGDGTGSTLKDPPAVKYPLNGHETFYTVQLTATNTNLNCQDVVTKQVKVLATCYIAVPTAFTPNGDGKNDFLYPLNAVKAEQLDFRVFNRWGQLVFQTNDWLRKWDGTIQGMLQPAGIYVWTLRFTYRDTGQKVEMKGTTMLIR